MAILSRGNLWNTGEKSRSTTEHMELVVARAIGTVNGASGGKFGPAPDVPKWMHSGRSASWAAANTGSQPSVWKDGKPSDAGPSTKEMALAPLAAVRSISMRARAGSHRGRMIIGI